MTCPIPSCRSTHTEDRLCHGHTRQLAQMVSDLHAFHQDAHIELFEASAEKNKGGEVSLGVNVTALSWINANDLYLILGGWERVIRDERRLTPAGLLPPERGVDDEVYRLVQFHLAHIDWSAEQPWADAYFAEVKALHGMGMTAARRFVERHTRIHCPSENTDGLPCRAYLSLNPIDPLDPFTCRGCGTEWTTLRLVAVAMGDRSRALFLDIKDAASLLGKSERQVWRTAMKIGAHRKGSSLVNLHKLTDYYAA